jgi:hypothetical protein
MYGTGIYFANNSCYSRAYENHKSQLIDGKHVNVNKMFLCFVIVGESVSLDPQNLTLPPLKKDHQFEV